MCADHLSIDFSLHLDIFVHFRFLEGLDEGVFIQQTIESVLQNDDGKQLLVNNIHCVTVFLFQ